MQSLVQTVFTVMSHSDLDIYMERTDLHIHMNVWRGTTYIQANFHRNSLKIDKENRVQMLFHRDFEL